MKPCQYGFLEYLQTLAPRNIRVLIRRLSTQTDAIRAPFVAAGFDIGQIFYFGESVLLPQFRGICIGRPFFEVREAAALAAGAKKTAFCAVVRAANDPRGPQGSSDLAPFWTARGYSCEGNLRAELSWKEAGYIEEQIIRCKSG